MINLLKKTSLLLGLIVAVASCASKKTETVDANLKVISTTAEIKKISAIKTSDVEEDTLFSVTEEEIKKSGTKPYVVYFDTNSAKLSKEATSILKDGVLAEIKSGKNKKVVIEAHTDERGSDLYNHKLSQKRANAVKRYLVKSGVKNIPIKAIGYGETKPVDLGHDEDAWAKNRRAVTIVIKR